MPIARIGYGTDFILKDQGVGIATDTADIKLKVGGTTKANYNITGIASLTNYAGFSAAEQNIAGVTTVTGEHSTLGDIVVGVGSVLNVSIGATVCTGSVESISITGHFAPPCGGVQDRQECPVEGTVRFNKDLNTLEFYNGFEWRQFTVNGASGRAVTGGGYSTPDNTFYYNLEYFNISSGGNSIDFGVLTSDGGGRRGSSFSSSTRGVFASGYGNVPGSLGHNVIEYITIASAGNAMDFGDASDNGYTGNGCSSSTRGVLNIRYAAPAPNYNNVMDYVEIATKGDAKDFGDLVDIGGWNACAASPTRGFFGGFYPRNDGSLDEIKFSTTGTAVDFGNLFSTYGQAACSNSVRAIFAGGTNYPSPGYPILIQSITMASTGSITDFGETFDGKSTYGGQGMASQTRGCIVAGWGSKAPAGVDEVTTIQYIDLNSGGTATYFGDVSVPTAANRGLSDSHGGLGGY